MERRLLHIDYEEDIEKKRRTIMNFIQVSALINCDERHDSDYLDITTRWEDYWLPLHLTKYTEKCFATKMNQLRNCKLPHLHGLSIHRVIK